MLKSAFLTVVALAIALGGGAGSVWLALDRDFEFGTIAIGSWTAFPTRGTPDADPYSRAHFSREADLALGSGEGLTFIASHDNSGEQLRLNCDYRIDGALPPARFWTLHARDYRGDVIAPGGDRSPALHSYALLREGDNTVTTTVSRHPSPGNWLAIRGDDGPLSLVLTFYDTALASGARISEIELPLVTRLGCDV